MKYTLKKKPKNATIIQGFPSIGLVSTIATKFLIEHLEVEEIGNIHSNKLLPLTAIHKGKLIHPITLYYNKKYNLIITQSLSDIRGMEWLIADTILKMASEIEAKEIITLEGTPSNEGGIKTYFYSNKNTIKGIKQIEEGVMMGVTAALFLTAKKIPIMCIFAEAHPNFPDSKAAAKIVESLDQYLKIKIDYKPLIKMAEKFEENLKKYVEQGKRMMPDKSQGDQKESYFG